VHSAQGLLFDHGIPVWFDKVDSGCGGEIETTEKELEFCGEEFVLLMIQR